MKHIPIRSCIVCRQSKDKNELIRIVRGADGAFTLDPLGKASGRGAYVCKDGGCFESMAKKRALSKAFKCDVPSAVYDELLRSYGETKTE